MTGSYSTYFGAISVKDPTYGAVGDGSTDDTAHIQAAFNAAMVTNGPKTVIFPPGTYKIVSPLYLINTIALNIVGFGAQIFYSADGTQGNIYDTTNPTRTPALMIDGVSYSKFSGISFAGTVAASSNVNFIGFYYFQSGNHGSTTDNMFEKCGFQNFGNGIMADGVAQCDNGILYDCQFQFCLYNGLRLVSSNAVNWQIRGGGADHCALRSPYNPETGNTTTYAAYSTNTGGIGVIEGVSCSGNQWDIINSGGQQMTVLGGSFEGTNFYSVSTASWANPGGVGTATLTVVGPIQYDNIGNSIPIIVSQMNPSGYNVNGVTGTITGANTITYPLVSNPGSYVSGGYLDRAGGGSISASASVIHVGGIAYRTGSFPSRWLDCTNGGLIIISGSTYGIASDIGVGIIASLGDHGNLIMDGCEFQGAGTEGQITGSTNNPTKFAKLWLRANKYDDTYINILTNFTGTVYEYDRLANTTVSVLPTAAAKFVGCTGSVTDGDASLAWGATVVNSGSGATPYKVWCNGTHWSVTGK